VKTLAENYSSMGHRLDGIDNRLDGIDNRLDGIDDKLELVETKIDRLQDDMVEVKFELKRKVDAEQFEKLEKRVVKLENLSLPHQS
jgi:archaellum component FlaC